METWMIVLLALCGIFNYAAGETARGWIKKTVDDSFWIVVCAVLSPAGSIFAFEYLAADDWSPGDEGMVPTVILLEIIQLGLLALVGFRLLGIENMAILFASFAAGYLRGYAFDLIGRLVKKIFSA
ncbi:hypothetical protein KKC32_02665, partial [Patescibacteria group bacterium]|nr:hypothetical protein [Patescibacteria group bacterium]